MLILDAIEKIEISLRTKLIYHFSHKHGSDWYVNEELFRDRREFDKHRATIDTELDRSHEDFIKHFNETYDPAEYPPCWMSLEIISLGALSKMFRNIKSDCGTKKSIALYYGLKNEVILENWIHCFSDIRNICAHHSRVFNRRFKSITIPVNPIQNFPVPPLRVYKLYAYLCCMVYILKVINPQNTFVTKLRQIIDTHPISSLKEMGFPDNWLDEPFWN